MVLSQGSHSDYADTDLIHNDSLSVYIAHGREIRSCDRIVPQPDPSCAGGL
jgi:hypothetical protein